MAHDDAPLAEDALLDFASLVARRVGGEPIAYLVGSREFYGREFRVSPAVLIPRPETELLVELAVARVGADGTGRILDLGTGSGCIAVSLALALPHAELTGVDASAAALDVARGNGAALGARVRWVQGDWFAPLSGERFDVIVANPPYVADDDPHLGRGDLRYEPSVALASGSDGLDAIRSIAAAAFRHLKPGGLLLVEHGKGQAEAVRRMLVVAGLGTVRSYTDLAGIERVVAGEALEFPAESMT
jgi:release factor glutamine methyltransferase